jgi:hypothetical protein
MNNETAPMLINQAKMKISWMIETFSNISFAEFLEQAVTRSNESTMRTKYMIGTVAYIPK